MKQKVTRFALTLLLSVLTAATAWANDPAGDSWDETTKTLTVNTETVAQNAYMNRSEIEYVIISNSVTSIGNQAFYNCPNLKTVFIGNGVTSIGGSVFFNCTNLKTVIMTRTSSAPQINDYSFYSSPNLKIYVPMDNNGDILQAYRQNSWYNYYRDNYLIGSWMSGTCAAGLKNGVLTVVGFGAFENCIGDNSRPNINSIVIEEGVTSIGDYAFENCTGLTSIEIPASVTNIGVGAFYYCTGLTSIEIPASVTSIGKYAFYRCGSLATITVDENNQAFDSREGCNAIIEKATNTLIQGCKNTVIPDGVQSIGDQAFYGCSGLTTVSIPDGVQSIGYNAFGACSNLESVNIGSGVASIGEYAFSLCHKLAIITVDAGNQTFDSREGCNAIIRKADNTLVAGCINTIIPNSVTSIGASAFWSHDGLTSITIPNSVTSIGMTAFIQCHGLRTVTIGSGVTSIGDGAFASCDALESVTIYATSVPTLGSNVFSYNKSGRKFYVFSDCVDAYKAAWGTYANDVEAIAPEASGTCGAAGNEDNVTWQVAGEAGHYRLIISGEGAMENYGNPLGRPWNSYAEQINEVVIENGVTSIGYQAFYGCTNLKTVFVSNDVTSIDAGAFYGCTNLKTVFVGNGVTSIGDQAFNNCTNLQTVIMTPSSAPSLSNNTFVITPNLKIYVPVDNNGNILQAYRQNYVWYNYYKNYIIGSWMSGTCAAGLKDGVLTVVGFGALENCIGDNSRPNINSIVIEEGVTSIGAGAFYGCSGLTTISIPDGVQSIGDDAFYRCGSLASITVDENNQAFDSRDGCNAIIRKTDNTLILGCKTTVIPNSVTSIGASAFYGCSGLTTISIPDGVQSIGDGAFGACFNLESVNIGSGVTSIAISAFNDCDKLATITVDTGNQTFDSREGCNAIIRKADNTLVAGCRRTVIPDGVQSIGDMAFWNHDGLTSITIPNSVTSIGGSAFASCHALKSVTIYATSVPTLGSNVFSSNKSGRKFYVFSDCVDAYKAAWGTYANDVEAIAPKASGTCGAAGNEANVTWQVAGEADHYRLIISGTGDMAEYASTNDVPWKDYLASITTAAISAGVTTINSCAFNQGTIINLSYTGTIPDGYTFGGYTLTDAGSNPVSVTGNNGVYTFTMPASNVTVTANLIEKIPYIDENGTTAYCTNYTVLDNTMTTISAGWYVVKSDVEFSDDLSSNGSGEMNFILCDGATLKANNIDFSNIHYQFRIYGQSQGTGTASISGDIMGSYSIEIYGGNINATGYIFSPQSGVGIYGGNVTAAQISGHEGSLYLKGGTITANELEVSEESIILTGATVKADNYDVTNGNVTIDTGKTYYDGTGAFYTAGNLDADQITAIKGKTLVPVTLSGTCGVDDPATGDVDESQNVMWLYDISTHTLTISGTGDMAEYASTNDVPWATYKASITTAAISVGVTTINSCAFNQGTIINLSYTGSVPDGYTFGGYTASAGTLSGTENPYTLTMPDEDVIITVTLKKLMTNNDITITIPSQTWTGIELTPVITVKDGETTLTLNEDYTVTAPSGPIQDAGNYTYTINGMGNYAGSKEATFTILPLTVVVNVTGNGTVTYNDKSAASGETFGVAAEKGTDVTLTLTPGNGYAVSIEYGYTDSEETTMIGAKLPINGTTATLTVPNDLKDGTYVNLTVTFVSALNGGADEASAVALTDATVTDLGGGWYKVDSDITFDHTLHLLGDTHLIIADGKTMTVNTATGEGILSDYTLFVSGEGTLSVATTGDYGIAVCVGNYVQTGATVTASGYIGIRCADGFFAFDFDNDFTFSGGQLTATGSGGGGIDADNDITLSCTNATDFIQASSYRSGYGAVKIAEGKALTDGTEASNGMNGYSGTLTDEQRIAIGGKTLRRAVITSYVEASGTLHENVIAIPLDNTMTTLVAGWYVVNSDVAYTGTVTLSGDVKLILADGCTMSFGKENAYLNATIMECQNNNLTIYGQSGGTGWLKAYSASDLGINTYNAYTQHSGNVLIFNIGGACINADNSVTLLGGTLDVESGGGALGDIVGGSISILGGKLWARENGLKTMNGKIILGYTKPTDEIYAIAYNPQNGLQIADGKTLVDDYGYICSGTLVIENEINDKTLKPVMGVTLTKEYYNVSATFSGTSETTVSIPVNVNVTSVTYNRTFTDGRPSTVMLPFNKAVSEIGGGTFYTFGGVEKKNNKWEATMNEVTGSLTANTPYLFVPTGTSLTFTGGATLNTTGGGNCLASDAEGWEFHGTYSKKLWNEVETHDYGFAATSGTSADDKSVEAGQFVRLTTGASAKPMRCYLSYVGGPNQARALTRGAAATDEELPSSIIVRLVGANGETTAIGTIDTKTGEMTFDNEAWYTLDGVRLSGKPTKSGLYIKNGKKFVIK